MISTKPYLIRAIREWALDNGLTPQVLVDATADGVRVPSSYVREGRITLNIHDQAVHKLELGNDGLRFSARFGGRSWGVEVPVDAVLAIFAKENGYGFVFEQAPGSPDQPQQGPPAPTDKGGPHLKVVK